MQEAGIEQEVWGTSVDRDGASGAADAGQGGEGVVSGNKNDVANARATWTAVLQSGVNPVAAATDPVSNDAAQ